MKKFILIFFFLFSFSFGKNIEIKLKDIVYISKYEVYLSDIATIKTQNKNFKNYLSSIYIKTITDKTVVSKEEILQALKKNFIDLSSVEIYGKKTIVVLNKTRIDKEKLEEIVKSYIKKHYPNIYIENISLRAPSIEVLGEPKISIKEKGKTSSYIYLDIKLLNINKNLSASIKYAPLLEVVVAKYPLPKGHIIKYKDVKISRIKIKRGKDYIDKLELAVGKKLKRTKRKGEPILFRDLEKQYLVRKNSNVKVIYNKGNFKIELIGRALENGDKGQIIKVKNISSGKVIQCKVIGINRVEFLSGDY